MMTGKRGQNFSFRA